MEVAYRTLFGLMRRKGLKIVPIHELSTFDDGQTLEVPGRPRRIGPQIGPDGLNRDSEQALRSLHALAPLPADLVLPGHGEPFSGGIAEAVRLAKLAGRS